MPPPPPLRPPATAPGRRATARRKPLDARGESRAERFLQAAIEVFLEKGYAKTRLMEVVERAGGGSLATLYQAYGDKHGLAMAVMERAVLSFGRSLQALQAPVPPRQALRAMAVQYADEMLTPEVIVSHRIAITEASQVPDLLDWFREHGVLAASASLADYFRRQHAAGTLHVEDPETAARSFLSAIVGDLVLRSLCGLLMPGDLAKIQPQVELAADLMIQGLIPSEYDAASRLDP